MKRNRYTKDYKAKVALEAVKGQKTVNELASEYGVHVSQINNWKKQWLEALPGVFNGRQAQEEAQHEAEKERLYQQIGKLQVEVDWLKKKLDVWDERGREAAMYRAGPFGTEHQSAG